MEYHSQTKKFIDFEFIVGADGVKIIKPDERFNPKFYFYYLETLNFDVSQKYTRHFKYLKKNTSLYLQYMFKIR